MRSALTAPNIHSFSAKSTSETTSKLNSVGDGKRRTRKDSADGLIGFAHEFVGVAEHRQLQLCLGLVQEEVIHFHLEEGREAGRGYDISGDERTEGNGNSDVGPIKQSNAMTTSFSTDSEGITLMTQAALTMPTKL